MIDRQLLNPKKSVSGLDTPTLCSVELMRFFAKDSVGIRVAVLYSLLGAEIAMRALVVAARLGLFIAILYASVNGLH